VSDLAAGWTETTIGEVVETKVEQHTPLVDEHFYYIDISSVDRTAKKIINPQKLSGKDAPSRARQVVASRDVLVSMTRPNLNAVAMVSADLNGQIASTGFDVLRAKGIDSRWLYYLVRTNDFVAAMSDLVQGALYPAVRPRDIRNFEIPLAPLNEQKRIADKLDTLLVHVDSCQSHLESIPQILERFRQSVLAAATSGRLTEDWREEQESLPDYRSVTLREVATGFNYGTSAKSQNTGKVPVLRMGNIQDGKLDWNDLVFTSNKAEIEKYTLVNGDVLFNRTNSPELVGKTAVYKGEQRAIHAGYLIKVKCGDELLPDFLNYCLNSPSGRDWAWRVKSDGVSQSNINAQKLADFEIELPPMEEQTEIVRRVESLFAYADRLEAYYQVAINRVDHLTPSLLAKAFRGELVEQDPNDEPASALLESVRVAKANAPIKSMKSERSSAVKNTSYKRGDKRTSVVQALKEAGRVLSTEQLFAAAGFPTDAPPALVEEFFVEIRDALENNQIQREREHNQDWFSLPE
jgi:type I restriction enzyme S subunit